MAIINPYVNFKGNAEEAFEFYKSVFGGDFIVKMRFKDTQEAGTVAKEDENKLMHIALPFGKDNVLMATDAVGKYGDDLVVGNNFFLSVSTESEEEATAIFNGLRGGGKVTMPLQKTFWGAFFGQLTDKFGLQWMVNYDYKKD